MADTDKSVNRTVFLTLPDEQTLVYILRHLHYQDVIRCTEGLSWNHHFITMYKEFGKYADYKEFKMAWDKIKKYLKENCPAIFSRLLDGMNEAILNELEETLGHTLPVDTKVSYRLCNG